MSAWLFPVSIHGGVLDGGVTFDSRDCIVDEDNMKKTLHQVEVNR